MTNIKDGFFGFASGTVARTFEAKTGVAAVVEIQDERSMYPDRVTAWGLTGNVREGDRVKVRGWIKVRPSTYTKRDGTEGHGVDVNINNAEIVEHEAAVATADSSFDESAPF